MGSEVKFHQFQDNPRKSWNSYSDKPGSRMYSHLPGIQFQRVGIN